MFTKWVYKKKTKTSSTSWSRRLSNFFNENDDIKSPEETSWTSQIFNSLRTSSCIFCRNIVKAEAKVTLIYLAAGINVFKKVCEETQALISFLNLLGCKLLMIWRLESSEGIGNLLNTLDKKLVIEDLFPWTLAWSKGSKVWDAIWSWLEDDAPKPGMSPGEPVPIRLHWVWASVATWSYKNNMF